MAHYRTLFVSDIHIGTKASNPDKLIRFLKENTFSKIYLVGDIIDMTSFRKGFFWKKNHNKLLKILLDLSKKVQIIYIIGNHDYFLEPIVGNKIGNIDVLNTDIHYTLNGDSCLVIHGHQFDGKLKSMNWLYGVGNILYEASVRLNILNNYIRKILKLNEWSLSLYLKSFVKDKIKTIMKFQELLVDYATEYKCDIVIAGHIHIVEDKKIGNIRYINCGCVTEYSSWVVEDGNGELKIMVC